MKRLLLALATALLASPALAHPGHDASSFAAGILHPLGGPDHLAAMVAVGLWAALRGGRAFWMWPATFVGVMLAGGALGMAGVTLPLIEPGILASVIVLGAMVALAVRVPTALGAALIAVFALCHGYAHGLEAPETSGGVGYMAGFALATAALHLAGIVIALVASRLAWQPIIRVAGAACVLLGAALALQVA